MPTARPAYEEIIIEIDIRVSNIIVESARYLSSRWKHLTTLDINNPSSSKYVRTLICAYNQTCDCNARIKIVTLYWYTFSSAHGMPSDLKNRF